MLNFHPYASSSKANLYSLDDGESKLLIECGLPIKEVKRCLNFSLSTITGCLLSHSHMDHARSAKDLAKAGVDIYTSQGTIDALGLSGHRIHAIKSGTQFSIGTWSIMPVESQHDAPEPLSFLIANASGEKALFATDTYYLKNRFRGLNLIVVECNYAADILQANVEAGKVQTTMKNRLLKSHFSLANVKEFLKANNLSKVQEIWLIHLSEGNSDEARFKREVQQITGKPVYVAEA